MRSECLWSKKCHNHFDRLPNRLLLLSFSVMCRHAACHMRVNVRWSCHAFFCRHVVEGSWQWSRGCAEEGEGGGSREERDASRALQLWPQNASENTPGTLQAVQSYLCPLWKPFWNYAGRVPRPTTLAPKHIREHPWHLTDCPIIFLSLVETLLELRGMRPARLRGTRPAPYIHIMWNPLVASPSA